MSIQTIQVSHCHLYYNNPILAYFFYSVTSKTKTMAHHSKMPLRWPNLENKAISSWIRKPESKQEVTWHWVKAICGLQADMSQRLLIELLAVIGPTARKSPVFAKPRGQFSMTKNIARSRNIEYKMFWEEKIFDCSTEK